jgi:hypothetical protein
MIEIRAGVQLGLSFPKMRKVDVGYIKGSDLFGTDEKERSRIQEDVQCMFDQQNVDVVLECVGEIVYIAFSLCGYYFS